MNAEKQELERIIGIRHRWKKTAKGAARPTQVCVLGKRKPKMYNLPDETAELDWVLGKYPIKYRAVGPDEDLSSYSARHVKYRRLKANEKTDDFPQGLLRQDGKTWLVATRVPDAYDGLQAGDVIAMVLGGSGDRLAFALSRRGDEINADVYRISPFTLKAKRMRDRDEDALTLAELASQFLATLFHRVNARDRDLIRLREVYRARIDAMKARIACEQRLRQQVVGSIFCSAVSYYPEGTIEQQFNEAKANDVILKNLQRMENRIMRELTKTVESLDVFKQLFASIEGVGPSVASRLIVAIGDIRRFKSEAKLKAFCGTHVLEDGRFARKRLGQVANWQPDARQALYLLGDQFNRRPNTKWGERLREYKRKLRSKHPDMLCNECSKKEGVDVRWNDCPKQKSHHRRYTNAHIHKMATWRTLTKFTEWLWREWWKLERLQSAASLNAHS